MRLAVKFFLAHSLVILVLAGIAAWSLNEVAKLSAAQDHTVTVAGAEALRTAASVREAVLVAKRVDMRSLVFADSEYTAASSANAARIGEELQKLGGLISTNEEKALLVQATAHFRDYHAAVAKARTLHTQGDSKSADRLLRTEAQPLADRAVDELDRLTALTRDTLDRNQIEAAAALVRARADVERLRSRTWTAVMTAMIMAVVLALIGTAVIAVRVTQSLHRLSKATEAVASGEFREPLTIDTDDEIAALARSFNTMAARLREIDEMKEKFYATVSHELRSPLNAMQEAVRLLESKTSEPLTARQERLIAIFEKGIERLLRLVNDVLELSRAAAGALPVERRPFAVEDAIKQVINEFGAQAEQQRVTLKAAVEPGVGIMVGDQDRIVQVLVNLVGNALRYTRSGGRVTVSARVSGDEIEFEVADSGIGIPADLIPVIFDRFRQAHSGKGGTGLGLAIVKSLVEAHGGHVSVKSREGEGSVFTIRLPRDGIAPAVIEKEAQHA